MEGQKDFLSGSVWQGNKAETFSENLKVVLEDSIFSKNPYERGMKIATLGGRFTYKKPPKQGIIEEKYLEKQSAYVNQLMEPDANAYSQLNKHDSFRILFKAAVQIGFQYQNIKTRYKNELNFFAFNSFLFGGVGEI